MLYDSVKSIDEVDPDLIADSYNSLTFVVDASGERYHILEKSESGRLLNVANFHYLDDALETWKRTIKKLDAEILKARIEAVGQGAERKAAEAQQMKLFERESADKMVDINRKH